MNFREWINISTVLEDTHLSEYLQNLTLAEVSLSASRYSVEVNFRTKAQEALQNFGKICLGYVSAAMKQNGYHVRQVYEETPLRIMVASRNFDDGEWIVLCSFNPNHEGGSFIVSKGFYNRDRKTISIESNKKSDGDSAAELTIEIRNIMHSLKNVKDKHVEKLNPVPLKTGPR